MRSLLISLLVLGVWALQTWDVWQQPFPWPSSTVQRCIMLSVGLVWTLVIGYIAWDLAQRRP